MSEVCNVWIARPGVPLLARTARAKELAGACGLPRKRTGPRLRRPVGLDCSEYPLPARQELRAGFSAFGAGTPRRPLGRGSGAVSDIAECRPGNRLGRGGEMPEAHLNDV